MAGLTALCNSRLMSHAVLESVLSKNLIDRFIAIVGAAHAITDANEMEPHMREWRDRYHGRSPLVLKPATVGEVSHILALASETRTAVVPQGGNTGLVGGQIPSGSEIVVSLSRLNRIRGIDPEGNTLTVDAGVTLQACQEAADGVDRLFPLSLGAEGTCQIGGNLSTNAGGVAVLAYGNTRDLTLGLEVVLPNGDVWDGLRALRKDNTGYALKHLFIGSEGTLGIITGAVLKLFPKPKARETVFAGVASPHNALALFNRVQGAFGTSLTSFEIMPRIGVDFCLRHLSGARDPLEAAHPWYVLIEISSGNDQRREEVEHLLMEALEDGLMEDAAFASSEDQRKAFWHLRTGMSEVQREEGGSIKHDVAVPVAAVPDFLEDASKAAVELIPGARPLPFGHLGDGNIHFNISQPLEADKQAFLGRWEEMNELIHGIVLDYGGTISAEHGIGQMKRDLMLGIKSEVEMDLMRRMKTAFDPNGIMNPGKVI